jgi:hypothetical protein
MPADDRDPTWFVLIEQNTGSGDSRMWSLTDVRPADTYEDAQRVARDLAFSFRPRHPMNPRRRSVFQVGDDTWVCLVEGATRSFHFRVAVARWLGDEPSERAGRSIEE